MERTLVFGLFIDGSMAVPAIYTNSSCVSQTPLLLYNLERFLLGFIYISSEDSLVWVNDKEVSCLSFSSTDYLPCTGGW